MRNLMAALPVNVNVPWGVTEAEYGNIYLKEGQLVMPNAAGWGTVNEIVLKQLADDFEPLRGTDNTRHDEDTRVEEIEEGLGSKYGRRPSFGDENIRHSRTLINQRSIRSAFWSVRFYDIPKSRSYGTPALLSSFCCSSPLPGLQALVEDHPSGSGDNIA
jgi:hypothetical protein